MEGRSSKLHGHGDGDMKEKRRGRQREGPSTSTCNNFKTDRISPRDGISLRRKDCIVVHSLLGPPAPSTENTIFCSLQLGYLGRLVLVLSYSETGSR
ncbi:hypothetical protein K2173_019021 [Erythroxylum novogranatense]|uniref:Uncharacterized protein n=1 Tax=Erythroxylum novogranatense TaxID=1862640 RepID=A0AAV8STE8_9ROSI|nr:hypothetical protein K2173_019021 [Erythroxylum novogranatense]